jgi:integrase
MQADIAAGKSARGRKKGRGGKSAGGAGVASRTIGTSRGLLGHAARLNVIGKNPAAGVRQLAVERRQRRLNDDELRHLGKAMRDMAAEGEHPTGLAAIRAMLLSGFRRMEVLGLEPPWVSRNEHCVRFPDTKSGPQIRVLGETAMSCLETAPGQEGSSYLFPADWGGRPFRRRGSRPRQGMCRGEAQGRHAARSSAHLRQCCR